LQNRTAVVRDNGGQARRAGFDDDAGNDISFQYRNAELSEQLRRVAFTASDPAGEADGV
jgi:hypothetical protein